MVRGCSDDVLGGDGDDTLTGDAGADSADGGGDLDICSAEIVSSCP